MTKEEIQNQLFEAHIRGTLIEQKHNPYYLKKVILPDYRTVIAFDVADDLLKFIENGIDEIFEFTNTLHSLTPTYLEIVPKFEYSTASSGVISFSPIATSALDRIVAVYGYKKGLHIFGEHSNRIAQKHQKNILLNKRKVNLR